MGYISYCYCRYVRPQQARPLLGYSVESLGTKQLIEHSLLHLAIRVLFNAP